jgi:hypothetical protein
MSRTQRIMAWITGIACVACCAMPLLGIGIGAAGVAGLSAHSELLGCIAAGLAIVAFLAWRLRRRNAPACKVDGACKPR